MFNLWSYIMKARYISIFAIIFAVSFLAFNACKETKVEKKIDDKKISEETVKMEKEFTEFADKIENEVKPLYTALSMGEWMANTTGKAEDFEALNEAYKNYDLFFSNKENYDKIKKYKEAGLIKDELLQRRLLYLENEFKSKQIDTAKLNAATKLQNEIVKKYNKYRPVYKGKKITDNKVEELLKSETNSKNLQAVWEAHKKIGPEVAEDIIKLVKMRNEMATSLGYKNFHEMSLLLSDQNPEDVAELFDELDALTKDAFKELKVEIDSALAQKCGIKVEELMPWHYQNRYFQEAPAIYEIDLDKFYGDKDLVELTKKYYKSIGMDIEDMVEKSDLFSREGKNQHAFCIDIDRDKKDVRVLCNVEPTARWMETMLHEYGHGVYFKYHDKNLPWILKTPAHTFTTEAIAMMFGRLGSSPQFMLDMGIIDEKTKDEIAETAKKILRMQQLVFSRWSQVMYRFEKSLYADPDQDLNKLWWDLVEKYQLVKKPEGRNAPDWASKTHIASSPCYYHNYHLGELLASQLYIKLSKDVVKAEDGADCSFYNNAGVGKYLIEKVFAPGAKYYWNDMIEKATGEKLTPKYYAMQFVK